MKWRNPLPTMYWYYGVYIYVLVVAIESLPKWISNPQPLNSAEMTEFCSDVPTD